MKGYLSVREISYKWNVSERWVSKLTQDGRILGVSGLVGCGQSRRTRRNLLFREKSRGLREHG